jgi:hypothetical protein
LFDELLEEVILYSSVGVVPHKVNGLLITERANTRKAPDVEKNLFKQFLADVEPMPWTIRYNDKYDSEDPRLHPMKMSGAPTEYKRRAETETITGHFMSPGNTLLVHRIARNFEDSEDFEMRMLAYYINEMGVDPYILVKDGTQNNIKCEDGMCAIRILGIINYAMYRWNFGMAIPLTLHKKLLQYLLDDPWSRLKKLKDMISLTRLYAMSGSSAGRKIQWRVDSLDKAFPTIMGYDYVDLEAGDLDHVAYAYVKSELEEQYAQLRDEGLGELAQLCAWLMTCEVTPGNLIILQWLFNLDGVFGFGRSETIRSHRDQAEKGMARHATNVTTVPYIKRNVTKACERAYNDGRVMGWEKYRMSLPNQMTNKSSGGYRATYNLPIDSDPGALHSMQKCARGVQMTFTEKLPVFLPDPDSFTQKLDNSIAGTKESPFLTGSRDVPGSKLRRAIFMQELKEYVWDRWLFKIFEWEQTFTRDGEGEPRPFTIWDQGWEYHTGKERPSILQTHVWSLIASCTPWLITADKDFSTFDGSHTVENLRRPIRDAIMEHFKDWSDPFGPWSNINEMVEARFAENRVGKRWYLSKGLKEGDDGLIEYDRLGSGEATTSVQNGIANKALQQRNLDRLSELRWKVHNTEYSFTDAMDLARMQIMGDDEQETWSDRKGLWNLRMHEVFVNTAVETAAENGYDLNKFKTLVRKSAAEFLKKYAIFGHMVPLGLTQFYAKERGGLKVDPIAKNADYGSLIAVMAARGFNKTNEDAKRHVRQGEKICAALGWDKTDLAVVANNDDRIGYAMRVRDATWCIARGVRYFDIIDGVERKGFVYLPAGLLYTPRKLRGLGGHWTCPYGTNRDAAIAAWCTMDKKLEALVEDSASVVSEWKSQLDVSVRKAIKAGLIDGSCDPKITRGMETMRSTMPSSRIASAKRASKELDAIGAPRLGSRHYLQYPQEMIALMLTRNAKMNRIKLIDQLHHTRGMRRGEFKRVSMKDAFPWIYAFDWNISALSLGPIVGAQPVIGLDYQSQRVMHRCGINFSGTDARLTGANILDRIRVDEFARRDLTEDHYYEELTKPEVLANPIMIGPKLMAMGVRPDIAASIAASFTSNRDSVALKLNITPVSFGDELLSNLNSSIERMQESVKCDLTDDENVKTILLNTGYMVYVQSLFTHGDCVVNVATRMDSMALVKAAIGRMDESDFHRIESFMARRWA